MLAALGEEGLEWGGSERFSVDSRASSATPFSRCLDVRC